MGTGILLGVGGDVLDAFSLISRLLFLQCFFLLSFQLVMMQMEVLGDLHEMERKKAANSAKKGIGSFLSNHLYHLGKWVGRSSTAGLALARKIKSVLDLAQVFCVCCLPDRKGLEEVMSSEAKPDFMWRY